jgi:predicted metal-dependent hydrolase
MQNRERTIESIRFGSETIRFTVSYRERKTLGISVYPDLRVEVTAPHDISPDQIREKVRKRAGWIIRQKAYFEKFLPHLPEKKYVSGESFRYLGRQYRLKLWKSRDERVLLKNGYLNVYVSDTKRKSRIMKLLDEWYRERAREQFLKRSEKLLSCFNGQRIEPHRIKPLSIELKVMAKRWGSCTRKGKILLNPELIKAPASCIEYVLMHELCHLIEHNHGARYYALLSRMMPDWEKRKERLEGVEV